MIHIANSVFVEYEVALNKGGIAYSLYADYKKWLRYYLDFCVKHVTTSDRSERKQLFLRKLVEKKQNNEQIKQASHAISLYFDLQRQEKTQGKPAEEPSSQESSAALLIQATSGPPLPLSTVRHPTFNARQSQYFVAGYQEKSLSPKWDDLISKLANEIKVRHYSRKTSKTYAHQSDTAWSFQPENNHDLYPLRTGQDDKRAEKPAGFLSRGPKAGKIILEFL